jgi:hypothetical protein
MKITALIIHYYPERLHYVQRIVDDLKKSTRPPDHIIIFNNDTKIEIKIEGVDCINTTKNYLGRSKYIACLLEPSDYYLLIDNDVTVGRKTIEHLIECIPPESTCFCTAQQGYKLKGKLLHQRKDVSEWEIKSPKKTDGIISSCTFCSFSALLKMLSLEIEFRLNRKLYDNALIDDLLMGFANEPVIYPAHGEERIISLPEEGVACYMQYPENEFTDKRDKYVKLIKNFTKHG